MRELTNIVDICVCKPNKSAAYARHPRGLQPAFLTDF